MRRRLEKGLPLERGTKWEVRQPRPRSPGDRKPSRAGLPGRGRARAVLPGPQSRSRPHRLGRSASYFLDLPGSRARRLVRLRWAAVRDRVEQLPVSRYSTAEELSFLPSLLHPPTSCRRALEEARGRRSLAYGPFPPHPLLGALWWAWGWGGGWGSLECWGTFSPSSGSGKGNAQFRETWGQEGREWRSFWNFAAVIGRWQLQQQGASPLGVEAQAA